jgi:hypothetical protein
MTNPYQPIVPNLPQNSGQAEMPLFQDSIDMGRAIRAPFKSPNWMMNAVWVLICLILSMFIVGAIVLFGYQMEVIERRGRGRSGTWPDFDPNRFGEYLSRGLWPWLVNIILAMGILIPLWIVMGLSMAIIGAVLGAPGEGSGLSGVLVVLLFGVFVAVVFVCVIFVIGPCTLRAGLAADFGEGFNFKWAIDFGKRVWGQMILAGLVAMLIGAVAELVGALACFVGLLATIPLAQLMITDLGVQLYDIYLTRGGQPVPRRQGNFN